MAAVVDIVFDDARWEALGLSALAERASVATLAGLGLAAEGFEISLLATSDARIAGLNADFRGKPTPTNVLSWPSEERGPDQPGAAPDLPEPGTSEAPAALGDIALAWETCASEAVAQGKAMADHVTHLVVHAVLHLLGHDHVEEADARLMESREVQILATLGISDPY